MNSKFRGSCLCGTVTFEISPPLQRMIHCHCSRCQKSTGTGHATNIAAGPDQLKWLSGQELITRFDLTTAVRFSKWFCSQCGCPLPRLSRDSKMIIIPAGSLDTIPSISPTDHIYWDSRVPWGCPSGGLATHAELPESL